jgi:Ca2+-dependent lipid-binding protein
MEPTVKTGQQPSIDAIETKQLIMSWQNYIVPISCSVALMALCWAVGYFHLSFLWIILFSILYVLKQHMWMKRENHRLRLRQIISQEREAIMAQFVQQGDLPAWVQFPDTERIEWVNKVIQQLWPYIGEYAKTFMIEFIEPQVRAQMPSPFKSFKFTHIDMGDLPCRVGGLKVYTKNVGRDRILVDMDVIYAGDAEFKVKTAGFTGGMKDLVLTGKVRCVLMPLLPYPPMVGGISGSFIELPKIDFNLTGMGEFVQLPGLIDAIRSVVNAQIANLCVLPNKIVVPLAPNVDITKLYFPEPDGIIRIKIMEARNLENKDISILRKDKSDPYCEIQVGAQIFRTKTINNDLNPKFNEYFEAVVDQASGQTLRIDLFDEDSTGQDEELGRLSLPLEIVRRDGVVDKWFHLEACKHGELHIKVQWFDLSTDKTSLGKQQWDDEWLADKPVHPAMVMVYIDTVSELPYPKAGLEPSPYVEVTLGRATQRTHVREKTVNPLYQSKFTFFVKQPEGQNLHISAADDGTKRSLGELEVPLLSIINQPNMEIFQQTQYLTLGIHASPIVMTIRLRAFKPTTGAPEPAVFDFDHTAKAYGTASHIERAERRTVVPEIDINGRTPNGVIKEAVPAEPGKTVEMNGDDEPHLKLDANNYGTLSASSPSIADSALSQPTDHTLMSKLKRPKHTKKKLDRHDKAQLHINMHYDSAKFKLIVEVIQARDITPVEKNGNVEPYVKINLVPLAGGNKKASRKTPVIKNTTNPRYDNIFEFGVHYSDLKNYKLRFALKDDLNYGVLHRPPVLGYVEVPLEGFDHQKPLIDHWLVLTPGGSTT